MRTLAIEAGIENLAYNAVCIGWLTVSHS